MLLSRSAVLTFTFATVSLCASQHCVVSAQDGQNKLSFDPYPVFVAQEEAFARCGPSADYYRTDGLRHGQELEVYAETDDGWLGVRPPEDSFCWIPAETVELSGSSDQATIVEDRTVAWIGTHLGRAKKYRWQVQLAEGEPVTIIGKSEREGPDGPQLWYRIVPPSGEFRWVHRDQVVSSSEELVASVRQGTAALEHAQQNQPVQFLADGPTQSSHDRMSQTLAQTQAAARQDAVAASQPQSSRRNSPQPHGRETIGRETTMASPSPAAQSGHSILARDEVIGSGLQESWEANQTRNPVEQTHARLEAPEVPVKPSFTQPPAEPARQRKGLIASVAFLGRPRLTQIGENIAPSPSETASDENWVAGSSRTASTFDIAANPSTSGQPITPSATLSGGTIATAGSQQDDWRTSNPVIQVSGVQPMPAQTLTPQTSTTQYPASQNLASQNLASQNLATQTLIPLPDSMPARPMNIVPADRISQIELEARSADIDGLSLIFSRLMAAQASGAEVDPVASAARQLASTTTDPVMAGRARLLSERADQYRRVASRRDGDTIIQSSGTPQFTSPSFSQASSFSQTSTLQQAQLPIQQASSAGMPENTPASSFVAPAAQDATIYTGQLVQVYSARPNSPPFALTDNTGRTIAYVTPTPGVNLRSHLNSEVSISGSSGYLTGLNMPHVLAIQAVRTMR